MSKNNISYKNKCLSALLILLASGGIFAIAQIIEQLLIQYGLEAMYISFCAGFILFTPLVSLALHPLLLTNTDGCNEIKTSALIVNIGLVVIVQGLFFLIWMTDAIAVYSIYVDSHSFLANAFNINSENNVNFSQEFYWMNLLLAWLFSFLSITAGLLPCLIARMKNLGVVGNFVSAFTFAKKHKLTLARYAFYLAFSVVMSLVYVKYLFIILFPMTLAWIFIAMSKSYLESTA